jgi:hypothetical protein
MPEAHSALLALKIPAAWMSYHPWHYRPDRMGLVLGKSWRKARVSIRYLCPYSFGMAIDLMNAGLPLGLLHLV